MKPYSESPFPGDLKNGITIEFSCRNDEEMGRRSGCKKPIFENQDMKKAEKNHILKLLTVLVYR